MAALASVTASASHMHPSLVQPIIFCGPGSNLYPLCSTSNGLGQLDLSHDAAPTAASAASAISSVVDLPKAMLPILNRPMIAYPLQQLLSAGLRHAIVFAPSEHHQQIASVLKSLILIPPALVQAGKKSTSASAAAAAAAAVGEASRLPNISVSVGLNSAPTQSSSASTAHPYMSANDFSVSSVQNETVMRVELLPLGPDDTMTSKRNADVNSATKKYKKLGTAGLLRWLHSVNRLDKDPLIVPLDFISQGVSLTSVVSSHVAGIPEPPALTCLMYERGAGEGTGKEREKDGPPKLFTAYNRVPSQSAPKMLEASTQTAVNMIGLSNHELLMLQDSDDISDIDSSDLHLRMSLLWSRPHIRISTSLLDSHIYLFSLSKLIGLLKSDHGLDMKSLREEVVPFIVKCGWMTGLREKAGWTAEGPCKALATGSHTPWNPQAAREDRAGGHRSSTYVDPQLLTAGSSALLALPDSLVRSSPLYTPDHSVLPSPTLRTAKARDPGRSLHANSSKDGKGSAGEHEHRAAKLAAVEIRANAIIVRLSADRKHPIDPSRSVEDIKDQQAQNGKVEQFIARANTVPTYLECNRYLLRSLAATNAASGSSAATPGIVLTSGALAHPLPNQSASAPLAPAASGLAASALAIVPAAQDAAPSTASDGSGGVNPTRSAPGQLIDSKAQVSTDSAVGDQTRIGERTAIKRSVVGRGCLIGKNVKLTGCIVMDGVQIGDNAKMENCILCQASSVDEKCNLKDCDIAAGVTVPSGTNSKNEKFDE
ncbi:hypothetical protein BCV70DRAFT_199061 [Testicularia cyperi]|uniref:Translation initiation factor eIF2B subunit gamma n=1 Tax=Testicularia cyperi TaxID=1882483 RepID=A0A317XUP4_9BASI|nr:hypothetical protein BCV70DRAFT_199061 [Testicularia cyperi]